MGLRQALDSMKKEEGKGGGFDDLFEDGEEEVEESLGTPATKREDVKVSSMETPTAQMETSKRKVFVAPEVASTEIVEKKGEEYLSQLKHAIFLGDRVRMDEVFAVAKKKLKKTPPDWLEGAGADAIAQFILAGNGKAAKAVFDFCKDNNLSLFITGKEEENTIGIIQDKEGLRRRIEEERDKLLAQEAGDQADKIEQAAREIGIRLPPPKITRRVEVERRVRELREKLRHGGVEAKFGKDINPEKIKEIFGREAREGILGVMMANLIKEQEGFSVANTEEEAREDVVIDRMLKVFQDAFSDNFTREQCEEMYFAAKSWMLDRAAQKKPQGFFARLFRPATKTGKVLKAGAYLATGVGSTLLTGPLGILITGALRQIDVAGNRILDEKMANKFRREKGGELKIVTVEEVDEKTGKKVQREKLEQVGGDRYFMDDLETNLANMLSVEARRAIDQDRPTDGMDLEERTQYYFKEILARPEIAGDQNLNEEEKMGIAQRLAVQYAIDDETEERRKAARGVPDSFWEKVKAQAAHYDPRVGRSTPASERFNTGMAATGIGIGLRLIGRTGWGQKLAAAYGGWQIGGALYEARYREQKDPMLNLEYRLQEADAQLKALKQEAAAGNWAMRDTREDQLREKLSEVKAVVETFPQDIKFRVRLQEAERRLEELRMELILVEFCKEQDERAYANETLIKRKLATAQAIAGGTTAFDRSRAAAVAREKGTLTWKGYGARIAGAAAGVLLAEGAHEAMEEWQKWREKQDAESWHALQEANKKTAGEKTVVPGTVSVEAAKTPAELEADFMKTHGILREQGFDVDYKDGKFVVTAEIGKGKDFRFLDQALRRITMQEYDFGAKTTYGVLDGGRVENSLANLRDLIFGHKTGGMIPAGVKDFVHFDAKTGELRIDDYNRLAKYYDEQLFDRANTVVTTQSGALAYTDNTGNRAWQEMLDQKTGDPGHITAENFNRDPLVTAAEHREFLRQANELGIGGITVPEIANEDTGTFIVTDGPNRGFAVHVEDGIVSSVEAPRAMWHAGLPHEFTPGVEGGIVLADPSAGKILNEHLEAWKTNNRVVPVPPVPHSEAAPAGILETPEAIQTGENMQETFARAIIGPMKENAPEGWEIERFSVRDPLEGDVIVYDPDGKTHTAKFDNGILLQTDNYHLTKNERIRIHAGSEHFAEDFFDILKTPRSFEDLLRSEAAGGLVHPSDQKAHLGELAFSKREFSELKNVNAQSFIENAGGDRRVTDEMIEPIDPPGSLARAIQALGVPLRSKTVGEILVDYKNTLEGLLGEK